MAKKKTVPKNNRILSILIISLFLGLFFVFLNKVKTKVIDWPTANQNYANTREASSSTINKSNVDSLGVAWSAPIEGVSEWGAAPTNPIIIGNTVYFEDLKSNVYALNYKTGERLWVKKYDLDNAGPNGVSVDNGRLFSIKGRYEVVALDLNGNELWSKKLSNNDDVGIDIQTTAHSGMVFVSTVPGINNQNFYKGGATGVIYALNQKTGEIVWSFDTVDSKDIWGNAEVNSGGGSWYPPAIDATNKVIYWTIGNPGPWPGTKEFPNGKSRPGDNLYTNSIVALDLYTGKLLWYNQVLPHDLFDYDLQISPILATLESNGVKKEVIFSAGKMGKVYAFDKMTGNKLWETSVGTHLNDTLKELPKGITKVSPGPLGGVETNLAYSDGVIYVPIVNMEVEYTPSEFVIKSFDISKATGEFVALDATTGEVLWSEKLDAMNVGSATVVNDLVFTSTLDGKIYAFDKKTGKKAWEYQAPGGINGWPSVKDDTIIFPVGMGEKPSIIAFKIGANNAVPVASPLPMSGSGKEFAQ